MIRLADVHKQFGTLPVLRGVSLALTPGRVTAIVGPNAAGKSTLIRCILGLTRPDSGSITLPDGRDVRLPAARAGIGYMPQLPSFPDNLTGHEVLAMLDALRPEVVPDGTLLEHFQVAGQLDKPVRTLSGGTRQKLSAVIAFRYRPSLLILDEPTAGLDPLAASVFKAAVMSARDAGTTVLLTTHVVAELAILADDVAFLLDGIIRFAGPVAELLRRAGATTLDEALTTLMQSPLEEIPTAALSVGESRLHMVREVRP
ncbi:MAG: ABC transporter ATP-binding protein [Gemmatimonadaceae bacterium]|nr:ABC transporter ATP-binding protein [Gemmatimonadaceae bacterium]